MKRSFIMNFIRKNINQKTIYELSLFYPCTTLKVIYIPISYCTNHPSQV